jgi:peroxiredoxin
MGQEPTPPSAPPRGRSLPFLPLLVIAVVVPVGLTAYRGLVPQAPPEDLAKDARDYLRARKFAPLSGPLAQLLADPDKFLVTTQAHRLLDQPAPEFALLDSEGNRRTLTELRAGGPVVLVFYYGYHCNHCVSQLFDLNEEMARFRELGTQVVAISADPPELTRKRFARYGAFDFPVLSDPDKAVARAYDVFKPADGNAEESLYHGTFVTGPDGVVRWAMLTDSPFNGTRTLLYEAARLQGRLPAK